MTEGAGEATAKSMLEAGANRLGCSASVAIGQEIAGQSAAPP